ncbi:hypothetical protein CPB86DRAFT_754144 [Serendipita vermifera]|nr:hypothetical protein CPB86DRAFT_754144 [Serendipita vermifera]
MDFINALDPASLTLLHSGVAFVCSPFTSPSYNLPIFLFGIWSLQVTDTYEPLRIFSGFVGTSILFDIIWLSIYEPATLIKVILVLNLLLKIPTFLSLMVALKHRGDRFGASLPGPGEFPSHTQTVWAMPTPAGLGAYQAAGGDTGPERNHGSKPLPTSPSPAPAMPTMPHVAQPQPSNNATQSQPGGFTIQ